MFPVLKLRSNYLQQIDHLKTSMTKLGLQVSHFNPFYEVQFFSLSFFSSGQHVRGRAGWEDDQASHFGEIPAQVQGDAGESKQNAVSAERGFQVKLELKNG